MAIEVRIPTILRTHPGGVAAFHSSSSAHRAPMHVLNPNS